MQVYCMLPEPLIPNYNPVELQAFDKKNPQGILAHPKSGK